jgi:hypothetical protein
MKIDMRIRDITLVALIGVGFFYVSSFLVGFAAAIAFPDWYKPFSYEYPALSIALFSIVTIVPAIILASVIGALVMVKVVSRSYVMYGVLAVAIAVLWAAQFVPLMGGYFEALGAIVLPAHPADLPRWLVFWCSLPLAAAYFGRRARLAKS